MRKFIVIGMLTLSFHYNTKAQENGARNFDDALVAAISANDPAAVQKAIASIRLDIDRVTLKDQGHVSYFLFAVFHSTPEVVAVMLQNDAYNKSGIKTFRGDTPLMLALWRAKNTATADILYNAGFKNVDEVGPNGYTALHIAVEKSYRPAVEWLMKHKANINAKDYLGRTPLMYALLRSANPAEMFDLLMQYHPDVNASDILGSTALGYAQAYLTDSARMATTNYADLSRKLQLLKAVETPGPSELAKITIEEKVSAAIARKDSVELQRLLGDKVNIEWRNLKGETLLFQAVLHKNAWAIKLLKELGAEAGTVDALGNDLLMATGLKLDEEVIPYIAMAGHIDGYGSNTGAPKNLEKENVYEIRQRIYSKWQAQPSYTVWQLIDQYMAQNQQWPNTLTLAPWKNNDMRNTWAKYNRLNQQVLDLNNSYDQFAPQAVLDVFTLATVLDDTVFCKKLLERASTLNHVDARMAALQNLTFEQYMRMMPLFKLPPLPEKKGKKRG